MDSSIIKNLLKLEIFTCKFCTHRLQYPIMRVGMFGNICGSCYERSVYIDVIENTDVEKLLNEMYLKCNFAERGCDFEDFFKNICHHERQCYFRDRICPFSYIGECENTLIPNLIKHISEEHPNKVRTMENNSVSVENPIDLNQDVLHLIKDNNKYYLLNIKLAKNKQAHIYSLYYFTKENKSRCVKYFIITENQVVNIRSESKIALREAIIEEESIFLGIEIKSLFLEGVDLVKIVIMDEVSDIKAVNHTVDDTFAEWFNCNRCDDYAFSNMYVCYNCDIKICDTCILKNDDCSMCGGFIGENKLVCQNLTSKLIFPCKHKGCDKHIAVDDYEFHRKECYFTQYECVYAYKPSSCKWKGLYTDYSEHLQVCHNIPQISTDQRTLMYASGKYYIGSILKNQMVFRYNYEFTKNDIYFKIGVVGPPSLTSLYLWEVRIKHLTLPREINVTDVCLNFDDAVWKKINIEDYLDENKPQLSVSIRKQILDML